MGISGTYDIGIVGWWHNLNYGGVITYFALNKVIEEMGYSVLMIRRSCSINDVLNDNCVPFQFANKYYNISDKYLKGDMTELNKLCNIFMVGSDQMWNPHLMTWSGPEYFLDFVNDDKKKIAYATSFGNIEKCDKAFISQRETLLRRFNAISVRENYAVDILKTDFHIRAGQVCDSIFLCHKDIYERLAETSKKVLPKKYVLNFILDPSKESIDLCRFVRKKLNIETVVNFTDLQNIEENLKNFNGEDVEVNAEIEDLVKAYQNAEFIVTDSLHGTCLAIIFNKPFISVINKKRGEKRFISLMNWCGLKERFVYNWGDIYEQESLFMPINYTNTNYIIEDARNKGLKWLRYAIETPKDQMPSIILPDTVDTVLGKKNCTGCSACENICPVNAISLKPDDLGYYRADVDYDKCIGCGKCIGVCPAIKLPENNNNSHPQLFEFIAADEKVLFNSSSGGAFPILANEAFKRNGIVVGAAWRDDFSVEHIIIYSEKDLYKLQKSKYLQSYMGNTLKNIKEKLDSGIFVLFSGCPCQAAGLKAYLQKEYDNLIIIDLLCGNAPSTLFFKKYMEEDFAESLEKYEFRYKVQGWNADCTTTTTTTGHTEVRRGGKQDSYQRVYHNHVMCPPHCENCKYQNAPRFGDITIGDFWGISKNDKTIDTSKGISAVLCNNEKGQAFFNSISSEMYLVKKQVPLEWLGGNGLVIKGSNNFASPKRNDFYEAIRHKSFKESITYALKPNHGIRSEKGVFDFSAKDTHFKFNPAIWNEDFINSVVILTTRERSPKTGNYAVMPIYNNIEANKTYLLKLRFKISTDASVYNFHLKSVGESLYQVIYSHKVSAADSINWVVVEHEFISDSNIYDEFMIGAAQLTGENRWIAIDYIKILEKR